MSFTAYGPIYKFDNEYVIRSQIAYIKKETNPLVITIGITSGQTITITNVQDAISFRDAFLDYLSTRGNTTGLTDL